MSQVEKDLAVKTVPCGGSSMGKGPEVGRSLAYSQNSKEAGVAGTEREGQRERRCFPDSSWGAPRSTPCRILAGMDSFLIVIKDTQQKIYHLNHF